VNEFHVRPGADRRFAQSGARAGVPPTSSRATAGGWYLVVTVLSAGVLAAIPFWHAWSRLRTERLRTLALVYTAIDVVLVVLASATPDRATPSSGNQAISTISGFVALAVIVAGCIQLRGIRRDVSAAPRSIPVDADPVMARAVAARQRRSEARKLWTSDPALARELGIGRPDLRRGFDDGGLVDLNGAPAAVIAGVCGIGQQQAEAVVAARAARGGYFNLGEVFVDVPLPDSVQGALTEHAVV
jgi:hypothetical protein